MMFSYDLSNCCRDNDEIKEGKFSEKILLEKHKNFKNKIFEGEIPEMKNILKRSQSKIFLCDLCRKNKTENCHLTSKTQQQERKVVLDMASLMIKWKCFGNILIKEIWIK